MVVVKWTKTRLVEHIDLFFGHEQRGQRTFSTFVRGVIYLKDDNPLTTYFSSIP